MQMQGNDSVRCGTIVAGSAVAAVADGQVFAELVVLASAMVEAAGALVLRRTLQVVPGAGRRLAEELRRGDRPAPAVQTRRPIVHARIRLRDPQRLRLAPARARAVGRPAGGHVHVVRGAHAVRLPVIVALHAHAHA